MTTVQITSETHHVRRNKIPRGKKQCSACQAFVGPRTKVCDCGHEFIFKSDADKAIVAAAKKATAEARAKGASSKQTAAAAVRAAKNFGPGPKIPDPTLAEPDHWTPASRPPGKKGAPPRIEKPHEGLSQDPASVVGVTDRQALDSFITQLKNCRKHSDYSGGCYSAFLHHRFGTLRVEVWLEPSAVARARVAKAAKVE